jgi:hypothetical protein
MFKMILVGKSGERDIMKEKRGHYRKRTHRIQSNTKNADIMDKIGFN